jgi:hypothetical protein
VGRSGISLSPYLPRGLVVPQPDELGMAQQAVPRPLNETDLDNLCRLHPLQGLQMMLLAKTGERNNGKAE